MRRFSAISLCLMFLALSSLPALACLVDPASMTPEEADCCAAMAGKCDGMDMDMGKSSHSCCDKTTVTAETKALVSRVATIHHEVAVMTVAVPIQMMAVSQVRLVHPSVSPPESPPGHSSILRI